MIKIRKINETPPPNDLISVTNSHDCELLIRLNRCPIQTFTYNINAELIIIAVYVL